MGKIITRLPESPELPRLPKVEAADITQKPKANKG
jgi:hypothetical protein